LNRNTGITVIMVSHDVRSAAQYASHILHLRQRQQVYGTAHDYTASEVGRGFLEGNGVA
jgi:zinc transport system ATP-binding protein